MIITEMQNKLIRFFIFFLSITILLPNHRLEANSVYTTFSPQSCPTQTDLASHFASEIDGRIAGLSGATSVTRIYTNGSNNARNSSIWTNQGTSSIDLSGISNGKSTLISPRHIIYARHFRPGLVGSTINFITNDNTTVTRTIVAQKENATTDIGIALLDSDVPESITHYPILTIDELFTRLHPLYSISNNIPIPMLVINKQTNSMFEASVRDLQTYGVNGHLLGYLGISGAVNYGSLMATTSNTSIYEIVPGNSPYYGSTRYPFLRSLINGDSGQPVFLVINGKPTIITSHLTTNSGPSYPYNRNAIITAMNDTYDAYELNYAGTRYTASVYDLSCFNRKPVITSTSSLNINEHALIGTTVGTILATDPDEETLNFSIISGNENDIFSIGQNTGIITLASSTALDYEEASSYPIIVQVLDSRSTPLIATSTATILISDETLPLSMTIPSLSVNENTTGELLINTIYFTGENTPMNFQITGGSGSSLFRIEQTTGQIYFRSGVGTLDYETTSSYTLNISLTDSIGSTTSTTTSIQVSDTNDAPTINLNSFSIIENATSGESVGTLTVTDQDSSDTHTWEILSGNTDDAFSIDENTGEIFVDNSSALNRDNNPLFSLLIEVTDSASSTHSRIITVAITESLLEIEDVTAPTISPKSAVTQTTNTESDTSVSYSLPEVTDDQDPDPTIWCSPSSGTDFIIGTSTVFCTASDQSGNIATSSFNVIVTYQAPAPSGGGGGGSGSAPQSGGGGGSSPIAQPNTPIIPNNPITPLNNTPVIPNNIQGNLTYLFSKDLTNNSTDEDVKILQKLLNGLGFIVSVSGAGSPGNETNYFGPATKNALIKYQLSRNISPAVGYFGPLTRSMLNTEINSISPVTNTTPTPKSFSINMNIGTRHSEVLQLQKLLNKLGYTISYSGAGSPGNETDYFGQMTASAVMKLQKDNAIDPIGTVGPLTRALLNRLLGQ